MIFARPASNTHCYQVDAIRGCAKHHIETPPDATLPGAGKFEKGAVAWVSSIDPAAGKEGFRIANEVGVEVSRMRRVVFRLLRNNDNIGRRKHSRVPSPPPRLTGLFRAAEILSDGFNEQA